MAKWRKSFTLIEMLIVLAIIAIIAVFTVTNVWSGQARARDSQRTSGLEALNNAIQMFYREKGHFPSLPDNCGTSNTSLGQVNGLSTNQVSTLVSDKNCLIDSFIKGLTPSFISSLPKDPEQKSSRGFVYFHYLDNSSQLECYKILVNNPENPTNIQYKNIWDPARDGGSNKNIVDGTKITAWSHYSKGCESK